jgi:hypothetical protein
MTKITTNANKWTIMDRTPNPHHAMPCLVCGKPVNNPKWQIRVHEGGFTAVTEAEADLLNQQGCSDADLGCHPIGANCLKKHPELQPYAVPAN